MKKYDSGIVVYDTDIDFMWYINVERFWIYEHENIYMIRKVEYDNW